MRLVPVAPARVPRSVIRPDVGVLFPRLAEHDRTRIAAEYPSEWRRALVEDAERIVAGDVRVFGRRHAVGWPPRWRTDPVTGRDAGTPFYTALLHPSDERVGDYRAVWELNRHASLITLARAAFVTGERRYASACLEGARGYLEENPTARGINWTSGLELALRAIVWTGAWCFLEAADCADDAVRREWTRHIARCAAYVRGHLSAHSSANNHLMGEAAALVVVGSVVRDLPDARRWRRAGAEIVARECERQIHRDGVGAEQSVHYLTFIAELIALAGICAARIGEPLPPETFLRLSRAAEFLDAVRDAQGHRPVLGDADDAVALPLGVSPHAMPDALASVVRGWSTGDAAVADNEVAYWLLAARLGGVRNDAQHPPVRRFAEGGVTVLRAGSTVAVCDTGPLGYLSLAAHGHADPLSLWVSFDGAPSIIDPGTGSYAPSRREERDYFRRARSHATLVVDDLEPADIRGAFLWGARYRCALRFAAGDAEWSLLEGEHDGFRRARVSVRRRVHVDSTGYVLVVDRVENAREHDLTLTWPCAPAFDSTDAAHVVRASDGRTMEIAARVVSRTAGGDEQPASLTYTHVRGRREPIDGWASLDYDDVQPCTIVRLHAHVLPGVQVLVTLLAPSAAGAHLLDVSAAGSRSVSARIVCGTSEHEWIALMGGTPATVSTENESVECEAERASVRIVRGADGFSMTARGSGEFRARGRVVRNDDEWTWRLARAAVAETSRRQVEHAAG